MLYVLWLVLGLLAILIGIGMMVLVTPLTVSARVPSIDVREDDPAAAAISWRTSARALFGAIQLHVSGHGRAPQVRGRIFWIGTIRFGEQDKDPQQKDSKQKRRGHRAGPEKDPEGKSREKKRKIRGTSGIGFAEVRLLLPDAVWLLRRIIRWPTFRLRGDWVYGFSDPFVTGLSHGALHLVAWRDDLRFVPDYSQARLSGWGSVAVTLWPIAGIGLVLRLLLRPGVRQVAWSRIKRAIKTSVRFNKRRRHLLS